MHWWRQIANIGRDSSLCQHTAGTQGKWARASINGWTELLKLAEIVSSGQDSEGRLSRMDIRILRKTLYREDIYVLLCVYAYMQVCFVCKQWIIFTRMCKKSAGIGLSVLCVFDTCDVLECG